MISIINGPNLNMQGLRQPEIYGEETFESLELRIHKLFPGTQFQFIQSNSEGQIIDFLQSRMIGPCTGIIINPGAYSHYSYAIADALKYVGAPTVEVHISNIFKREEFRHTSVTASSCDAVISGMGMDGYIMAVKYLLMHEKNQKKA